MVTHISTRYFVLLTDTKEEAKKIKDLLEKFIHERLHLEFNTKTNYYPNRMGVNFCGYQVFKDYLLVKGTNKKKIKKKVKRWNEMYQNAKEEDKKQILNKIRQSWNSWLAHSTHANTYHLQEAIYKQLIMKDDLISPLEFRKRQEEKQQILP